MGRNRTRFFAGSLKSAACGPCRISRITAATTVQKNKAAMATSTINPTSTRLNTGFSGGLGPICGDSKGAGVSGSLGEMGLMESKRGLTDSSNHQFTPGGVQKD